MSSSNPVVLPSSVTLSRNDPELLALLARGLASANEVTKQQLSNLKRPLDKHLNNRQYRVLDSLAYVLVPSPEKQVVAVGVVVQPASSNSAKAGVQAVELLIAENSLVADSTYQQAEKILQHLRATKGEAPSGLPIPRGMTSPHITVSCIPLDTPGYLGKLAVLEIELIEYCWKKLRHRFLKNARADLFLDAVARLRDPETQEPPVLKELQASNFNTIFAIPGFSRVDLPKAVAKLKAHFTRAEPPTSDNIDHARYALHVLERWVERVSGQQTANNKFIKWNEYIYSRCASWRIPVGNIS